MENQGTVTGQCFASESNEAILDFLREQLPSIREGKLFCRMIGGDSIVVAYLVAEEVRELASDLLRNTNQHEHTDCIPLQSQVAQAE